MRRCAIYTRKSTEDGLEQSFNSLHAQREACEAFIKSQRHEGWRAVRGHFDDGGFSGGSMDRPALTRLLEAVQRRQIDIVVVYKVDRLTRSLADFAKIVEAFDAHGVSFVSVTQAFNTTTSMGRLTLNVLLSFAQFEREVTAERIRDKIAASKKKGMWMGGLAPLGYDVVERKLVVNEAEAETVRTLFRLYRDLGTVRRLKEEVDRRGIVTKRRRLNGKESGSRSFSRGNLYQLLSNPLYVGRVPHNGETYPGQHAAIVDDVLWTAAQDRLAQNAAGRRLATNAKAPALLAGLVHDETGDRLCPTHACKKGRRYRYYISKRLMHDAKKNLDGWRLPAAELEDAVLTPILDLLRDRRRLIDTLQVTDQRPYSLIRFLQRAETIIADLDKGQVGRRHEILRAITRRIDLSASSIAITLSRGGLAKILEVEIPMDEKRPDDAVMISVPIALRRRGVEAKLVIADPGKTQGQPDRQLCRLVARARLCFDQLASGEVPNVRAMAERDGLHESEISRILPLAFLAPDIVKAILDGRQPVELTAESLRRLPVLPTDWDDQRRLLGFSG